MQCHLCESHEKQHHYMFDHKYTIPAKEDLISYGHLIHLYL